jgi:hypothetical protein
MPTNSISPQSEFCPLSVQIWTVVTLVEGKIACSIHASEHDAYCEAVSRFEGAELAKMQRDPELRLLLRAAKLYGDYQKVHQHIENIASKIQMIQLAEHSVHDFYDYEVRMQSLTLRQPTRRCRHTELDAHPASKW